MRTRKHPHKWLRDRIVDALRLGDIEERKLYRMLLEPSQSGFHDALIDLKKAGRVEHVKTWWTGNWTWRLVA